MENNKENRNYLQTRKVIGLKDYQIEMIEKQAADLGSESSELKADCITEKSQELPGVFLDDFGDARISLLPDSGCFRACGPASLSFPKRFRAVCKRGRAPGWLGCI